MSYKKYDMRKAEQRGILPAVDLLPVLKYKGEKLDVAIFGPNTYKKNLEAMGKQYFHSSQLPNVSFRNAKTQESISVAAYGFGEKGNFDARRDVFNSGELQTGPIVRTQEGVFINTTETSESRLKQLLNGAEKVNGIYLLNNRVAFAPYDSFETDNQDVGTFAQGGLARALEHTPKKVASQLKGIGSFSFYKKVDVSGFDSVKNPVARVASLYSVRDVDGYRLRVDGYGFGGSDGYAFGVSK